MSTKVTDEHLRRGAVVYVRQSTITQVLEHKESQRRQYALADRARSLGFDLVETIDDDLGRSGSGLVKRPGFQKLVALVCTRPIGAIFCIEASRLARNGRDWHQLIDLCSLVGTLVIDADGVYDPRLTNDRLLLGLKGTMSEYELNLFRQRSLAARDAKAKRGELQFQLPPGYQWDELGRIELDPDERVVEIVRLVFRKFVEFGSVRQVYLWFAERALQIPVRQRKSRIGWRNPAYHNIRAVLTNPLYAGAYVFGRKETRTRVIDGRAVKTTGHPRPREKWGVLIRDHHPSYISWDEFERNMSVLSENAHMRKRAAKKAGRGGQALLTGMLRCGRCGHMLHVFYGNRVTSAHRYMCRGSESRRLGRCLGIGGIRVDRAVSHQVARALEPVAIEAAIEAAGQQEQRRRDICETIARELESAKYEASLAEKRHHAVDPEKRLVARELEERWERALAQVAEIEARLSDATKEIDQCVEGNTESLLALSKDIRSVWNSERAANRTRQRIVQLLICEIIVDITGDEAEVVLLVHWSGGRHTEIRVPRKRGFSAGDEGPTPVEAMRKMGGRWTDREVAVALNRARCRHESGGTWTTVRVSELREKLGIAAYDPSRPRKETVTADEAAIRLGICIGSIRKLINEGTLPAEQVMKYAPWEIPVAALDTDLVRKGVQAIKERRPRNYPKLDDLRSLKLPGFDE